ncbi:unnamed protein product [Boreogadus saida]
MNTGYVKGIRHYVIGLEDTDGKRYLSDNEAGDLKQGPEGRYATLKGYQRLREFKVGKPSEILCSENIFFQYLQDRYQA